MAPSYFGHMAAPKWICFSASYAYPWQEAMKAFWLLRTPCFISTIHILIVDQLQSLNYGVREHLQSPLLFTTVSFEAIARGLLCIASLVPSWSE